MIVVVHHIHFLVEDKITPVNWVFDWTPLSFIINGPLSVKIFFVLSGFVLALPYLKERDIGYYKNFLIKRVTRIYFPFLFSIIVALFLWVFTYNPEVNFAHEKWNETLTFKSFTGHIFMSGIEGHTLLNGPIWTLIIEMRIAVLFPILVIFVKLFKYASVPMFMIAAFLVLKLIYIPCCAGNWTITSSNILGTLLLTLNYAQYFIAGIFIAFYREKLDLVMNRIPLPLHFLLIAFFVFLPHELIQEKLSLTVAWEMAVSCYVIMACLAFPKVNRALCRPSLLFAGKVSYSLYLMHMPVLMACIYILSVYVPVWVSCLCSIPLIGLITWFTYKYVEVPCINLGYKITSKSKLRS